MNACVAFNLPLEYCLVDEMTGFFVPSMKLEVVACDSEVLSDTHSPGTSLCSF